MAQHLVRHIRAINPRHSTGLSKRVFAQMQLENAGVHGPFLIHAAQPTLLAAVWALFREVQLASGVPRAHQETIALLVAKANRCPWCVEAHELALHTQPPIPEIATWYAGHPNPLEDSLMPGANDRTMIAHRAAVLLWGYINRMTNVLLVESAWQKLGPARGLFTGLMGRVFGALFLHRRYQPGRSLEFVVPAPLPEHLAWAQGHEQIAAALASFHGQISTLARDRIPPEVQAFVLEFVRQHRGRQMGLSRRWASNAVQDLEPSQQTLAQILLLIALAVHQIDDDLVSQLRQDHSSDADLIAVLAWGSYAIFNG